MQKKVHQLKNHLPLSAGLLCFCFALSFSASAQKIDTAKKLKEVNITTKALPQIQTVTPSQQLSANDFDKYSAFNVADAIQDFAGVNIKDYGGIGGLKTVSVRSLGANHLAVLYDGVQVNDTQNGQIDLGKINLDNVQEITLYNGQPPGICMPARSFASASVLDIKTIRPNLTASNPYQVLLGVKGGSFGLINPYLQWQQRISDRWSFIVNSYLENANGRYKYKIKGDGSDSSVTRTDADVSAQEADGALYWTKNDSNKFNLHLNYYNSDRGVPGAVVFYNPTSNERLWNKDIFVQSGYEHLWSNSLHLLINSKLSQDYVRYVNPDFLNNQGGLDERYTQREFYQSVALSYHVLKNWEIGYSADVSFSDLDANLYQFAYPTRFSLLNVLASNFTIGKWRFQGNLLNTHIQEKVKTGQAAAPHTVFSPTLMATYQPLANADLQLRAFYKDIFRYPTFDEQYFFAITGPRLVKPEYVKEFDAGITYRKALNSFFDYVTFSADGYYNNVINKIVALPNPDPAKTSIINLGKVGITGIDVGVKTQTKTADGWHGTLSVNYTYQDAIDITSPTSIYYNLQIPYAPKNTLACNGGVDYKSLGLYYNLVLSSSRYYLSNNSPDDLIDGYSVSDLSLIYQFKIYGLPTVLSAHANNLFNDQYAIVQSYPMPGRSYLLSFQIKI